MLRAAHGRAEAKWPWHENCANRPDSKILAGPSADGCTRSYGGFPIKAQALFSYSGKCALRDSERVSTGDDALERRRAVG